MSAKLLAAFFAASVIFGVVSGSCPDACACSLDARGRRHVECLAGKMADPIPVVAMDNDTEVLLITAPEDKHNALTIGPIFTRLAKLEEVRIERSAVPAIGRHPFLGAERLRSLDLGRNHIAALLDYNFRGLGKLSALRLAHNQIASAPSGSFRHLVELRELALNGNKLTQLEPRLFLMLGKLAELDLSGNPLRTLEAEVFKDVQTLHTLRIRGCGLGTIPGLLYHHLPELRHLDAGGNLLTSIGAEDFRPLRHLRTLRLDGNHLAVIAPRAFAATALQTLDLARNKLTAVTEHAFEDLDDLLDLDLGYNGLARLDPWELTSSTQSLRSLRLAGNKMVLADIRNIVASLPHLQSLDLSSMNLSDLPLDLLHDHIARLNLSDNRLEHLPERLRLSPAVVALDLSGNLLNGLPERLAIQLATLKELRLSRNLWRCDRCHVLPLLSTRGLPGLQDTDKVLCAAPAGLSGSPLSALRRSDLAECDKYAGHVDTALRDATPTIALAAFGACAVVLLLVAVIGVVCAMRARQHAARYYTNEQRRPAEPPDGDCEVGYHIMGSESKGRWGKKGIAAPKGDCVKDPMLR